MLQAKKLVKKYLAHFFTSCLYNNNNKISSSPLCTFTYAVHVNNRQELFLLLKSFRRPSQKLQILFHDLYDFASERFFITIEKIEKIEIHQTLLNSTNS